MTTHDRCQQLDPEQSLIYQLLFLPACFIIPQTIMHQLSGKIQLLVFRSKVVVICSLFNCLILTSADIFTLSNQRQRQLQQFLL